MRAATVDVYRLEHVDNCSGRHRNHGPFMREGCSSYDKPPFGTAGHMPDHIEDHEVCGVTARQARYWWSTFTAKGADEWVAAGWQFVHYRVPVGKARDDRGQVVFPLAAAERVGPVGFPRKLCPDRRMTWQSRNRFHDQSYRRPTRPVTA